MAYKNFDDIPIFTQIIITIIGIWGAIINYLKRDMKNATTTRKVVAFFTDFLTAFGLTALTFMALAGYNLNEVMAAGIAGWVGHQGTRAIYLVELIIAEKVKSKELSDLAKEKLKEKR